MVKDLKYFEVYFLTSAICKLKAPTWLNR